MRIKASLPLGTLAAYGRRGFAADLVTGTHCATELKIDIAVGMCPTDEFDTSGTLPYRRSECHFVAKIMRRCT